MNTPHFIAYVLSALAMITVPVILAVLLRAHARARWVVWLGGAVTFLASQAVHLPLLIGLDAAANSGGWKPSPGVALAFNAVTLGLLAGLCEELARYVALRWVLKRARRWGDGLMFGAGHGGIEAILIGLGLALQVVSFVILQVMPQSLDSIPPDQRLALNEQLQAFWNASVVDVQAGWLERCFALCLHLACALLVLQAVRRRRAGFLVAAIAWHALADGVAVATMKVGIWPTEAALAGFAAASVGIILALRGRDTDSDRAAGDPAPASPEARLGDANGPVPG